MTGRTCTSDLAHAGDTRAYLLRDERLVQLTRDHTLSEDIRRALELSPDEADSLPEEIRALRDMPPEQLAELPLNVITRALGMTDSLEVDLARIALRRGDRLVLCTDGLHALVDPAAITAALRTHAAPVEACDALVDAALRAGGYDNITVLVADVDGVDGERLLAGSSGVGQSTADEVSPVASSSISIEDNERLPSCEVEAFVKRLDQPPEGVNADNNGTGACSP